MTPAEPLPSVKDFLRVADRIRDPLLLVRRDGRVLAANRAARRQWRTRGGELAGCSLGDLVTDPADAIDRLLALAVRSGDPMPGALTLRQGDRPPVRHTVEGSVLVPSGSGEPGLVCLRVVTSGDPAGRFVALTDKIAGLNREIARRRKVEETLRRESEWREITLASIGDAVIATDARGYVWFMNPKAQELTGWPVAEANGRPLADVFSIVNETTGQPLECPVTRVLRTGLVVGLANHTLLRSRDGRGWPIDDSAAPIRDVDGTVFGVVLVFHDVTERRRLEHGLRAHAASLQEADRRKDEFLAMLAHELRNPMAAIQSAVDLLRHAAADATVRDEVLVLMQRQMSCMRRLVDDLLDVARITRGRIELRPVAVELAELVREAATAARDLLNSSGIALHLELSPAPLVVHADPVRLDQVLGNLLSNAARFTPAGGEVRIRSYASCGAAVLEVADSGAGIPPDLLPRVFDVFAQGEQPLDRSGGGLGIGLTLVKHLVLLHGGSVAVVSPGVGQGTTVRIELPLPAVTETAIVTAAAPALPAEHLRVLIVDDNRDSAWMLAHLLQVHGHQTAVAHDGPSGLAEAARFQPDVLLLDIGLPGMDGYEVARRIRSTPELAGTALVAVSGYGHERDRQRSREAGFESHLVKPVELTELEALLRRLAEERGRAT